MKKVVFIIFILGILLFITSCTKDRDKSAIYNLTGKAQKGPFAPGAKVTISELDEDLNPTGRNFYSTIMDYEGYFQIPNVELESDYVEIIVEGTPYSEFLGLTLSMSSIILSGIVDLSISSNNNVNILTHLERDRLIKYKQEGYSFDESKHLAQQDVLRIFNLDNLDINNSESLDISSGLDQDAVLLAVSLIVQGSLHGLKLSTFLTAIRNDLNDNGILNSTDIQTKLISQARFIYAPKIIKNLNSYYQNLNGGNYQIPPFQKYIDTFLVRSDYISIANYQFPEISEQGINLLHFQQDTTELNNSDSYSFAFQTYPNTNISMSFQVFKESGNVQWTTSNIQNWTIEQNNSDYIYCKSHDQENVSTDMLIEFSGQGVIKVHVSVSNDYQMINAYWLYFKCGY